MEKREFFNGLAADWDQRFYTSEMRGGLPKLVSLFQLQRGSKVLDVGAGTGGIIPYLLKAIGPHGSIWAIDFAGEMVKVGKKKFQGEGRVSFEIASVEALPFEKGVFDHVICFGAFPHFEDKPGALKEMGRVLKPQGAVIIAHGLSSAEIRRHHQNCAPVSKDFLPDETQMKSLLGETGFKLQRLIDQPKCYLCEGVKTSST